MIQDLMIKGKEEFLEHFARLGVFSKVGALAGPQDAPPEPEVVEPSSSSGSGCLTPTAGGEAEQKLEDAKELLVGKAYHWRDWCICRGRDCLYVWSDAAALELSNGSNGWFRFILDGKLATMYSSGSPEGGTDTTGSSGFSRYIMSFMGGIMQGDACMFDLCLVKSVLAIWRSEQ